MGDYADDFGEPPEPRGKKGGGGGFLKVCLICGCIVILLAGLAMGFMVYTASQMVSMDPATIATRTQEIVPCTIPPGYQGAFAMKIPMAFSFVMIGPPGMMQNQSQPPGSVGLMIMLMTIPAGQNADQMKSQMNQQMQQRGQAGPSTEIEVESTAARTFKIRGQDVEFTEQVGAQSGGQGQQVRMRQLTAVIPRAQGSTDQLLLMFMGPEQGFDQAAMEAFLASIR